jgi:phage recombination protein Bet
MNQLQKIENKDGIASFSQTQIDVIRNTIAKDATNDELTLFAHQCSRTGLDPFTRQIYFIKDTKGKVTICTSIDGLRLIAERNGKYQGQTETLWCGEDGVWTDIWLKKQVPKAAKVGVYKAGFREPLYAVALFDEYCVRKYDGALNYIWAKMPALMIAKVAEALALRRAFPNDLSGIYSKEEGEIIENNSNDFKKYPNSAQAIKTLPIKKVEGGVNEQELATLENIEEMKKLIEEHNIPVERIDSWLQKANVLSFSEMKNYQIIKCIEFIKLMKANCNVARA